MTEKKHHKEKESKQEEANQTRAEAVAVPESGEQLAAEIEVLKKQLEEAQTQASEYKDSWMRSQAEFQNYKKRLDRDNEMMYSSMKGDIIKKVLPVLDDLERALREAGRPADDSWANGIELIARKLQNLLDSEGLKRIEAKGAAFDPNFHEAISHEPADDVESGHVIEVVQNGYMLGDRVIRPALVRVAQ